MRTESRYVLSEWNFLDFLGYLAIVKRGGAVYGVCEHLNLLF